MVKLPPDIVNSALFIGSHPVGERPDEKSVTLRGTGFLIARPIPGVSERSLGYLVTARHVLDGIEKHNQQPCFRATVRAGFGPVWLDFDPRDEWVSHPDRTVDAAVMKMATFHIFDLGWIPTTILLTDDAIAEEEIGVGTEVFMTGLFANHPGRERNIPIVRIGNIAAMRGEPISTQFGDQDAFLVEARSIGGLSGSPVFAHVGIAHIRDGQLVVAEHAHGVYFWMGLAHGHYDEQQSRERVNMGIAIVVPAVRIMEIFDTPYFKKFDDEMAKAGKEQLASANKNAPKRGA